MDEISRKVIKSWAKRVAEQIVNQKDLTIDEAIEKRKREAIREHKQSRETSGLV